MLLFALSAPHVLLVRLEALALEAEERVRAMDSPATSSQLLEATPAANSGVIGAAGS